MTSHFLWRHIFYDVTALRANEHAFIIQLHDEWGVARNLGALPNWAFSLPYALFMQSVFESTLLVEPTLRCVQG